MQRLFLTSIVLTLLVSIAASAVAYGVATTCPTPGKDWRVGAMFTWYDNNSTRAKVGSGWGVEIERSFGRHWANDLSLGVAYRRFSHDVADFSNGVNYYSLLAKLRWGKGASPSNDGFYYGLGGGLSLTNETIFGVDDNAFGVEGLAMFGWNFAKAWYADLSYRSPVDAKQIDDNNISAVLGYRF